MGDKVRREFDDNLFSIRRGNMDFFFKVLNEEEINEATQEYINTTSWTLPVGDSYHLITPELRSESVNGCVERAISCGEYTIFPMHNLRAYYEYFKIQNGRRDFSWANMSHPPLGEYSKKFY